MGMKSTKQGLLLLFTLLIIPLLYVQLYEPEQPAQGKYNTIVIQSESLSESLVSYPKVWPP